MQLYICNVMIKPGSIGSNFLTTGKSQCNKQYDYQEREENLPMTTPSDERISYLGKWTMDHILCNSHHSMKKLMWLRTSTNGRFVVVLQCYPMESRRTKEYSSASQIFCSPTKMLPSGDYKKNTFATAVPYFAITVNNFVRKLTWRILITSIFTHIFLFSKFTNSPFQGHIRSIMPLVLKLLDFFFTCNSICK